MSRGEPTSAELHEARLGRTLHGGDIEIMRHGPTNEGMCDIMNISELVTSTPPGLDPCASPFISLNDSIVTSPVTAPHIRE